MGISLSIKDVPDDVAKALRTRATQNHRSLQGELMAILEDAVRPRRFRGRELLKELQNLNLSTPSESTRWIREDRDR